MSDTPRTDAAILRTVNIYIPREDGTKRMVFELVEAAVSRQLERELARQVAAVAALNEDCKECERKLAEARAECEALRRDKERMDWVDRAGMEEGCGFRHIAYGDYRFYAHQHFGGAKYPLARQVIDAALAQDTQREP